MKDTKVPEKEISKFYSDVMGILLTLSDERIAEIYCELNGYNIPKELANIPPYIGKESSYDFNLDYWVAFANAVESIVPKQTITKAHYRNLLKGEFDFGSNYIYKRKNGL